MTKTEKLKMDVLLKDNDTFRKHISKLQSEIHALTLEKMKAEVSREQFKIKHRLILDDWNSLRQMLRMLARDENDIKSTD